MQFDTKCAILKHFCSLIEKLCSSNVFYLTINACKEIDNDKNGRLTWKMVGKI